MHITEGATPARDQHPRSMSNPSLSSIPSSHALPPSYTRTRRSQSAPSSPTAPATPPPSRTNSSPIKPHSSHKQKKTKTLTSETEYQHHNQAHTHTHHYVNIYTECGRHSNEWLFGGLSLADIAGWAWGLKDYLLGRKGEEEVEIEEEERESK